MYNRIMIPLRKTGTKKGKHRFNNNVSKYAGLSMIQKGQRKCSAKFDFVFLQGMGNRRIQKIGVLHHPPMRFSRPKLDEMPVQFEDDGSITYHKAHFPEPWLQETLDYRRLKELHYHLEDK
ncbi:unnamed protein product [Acanthoscelides obtectus]|uniref:Uncharacterized protein n=1 Tax=Acanthoscelides obtectus TaxID=200917 RepID=A0A9P0L078_ACAOB|nr:unnamed protein product [Acanthoscelides obtectus]CAK1653148.1 hypothetical protein AOBTE_LOCUS18089 [Acanthoscelides obtectus]